VHILLASVFWCVIEVFFRQRISLSYLIGTCATLFLALFYYLVWLPSNPEHAAVERQWKLPWLMDIGGMIIVYSLIAAFVVIANRNFQRTIINFRAGYQRLFLALWVVTFCLSNHEAFFEANQPIHFTRGYDYISLFFLALPGLALVLRWLPFKFGPRWGTLGIAALTALFLTDNIFWMRQGKVMYKSSFTSGIKPDSLDLVEFLGRTEDHRTLLITTDTLIANWAVLYSGVRVWNSHKLNNPDHDARQAEANELLMSGWMRSYWRLQRVVVIVPNKEADAFPAKVSQSNPGVKPVKLYSNSTYTLYLLGNGHGKWGGPGGG
jgi:hypothetical protein